MTDTTQKIPEKLGFWKRFVQAIMAFERTEEDYLWDNIRDNRKTIRTLEAKVAELQS